MDLWVHADIVEDVGADEFQVTCVDFEVVVYLGGQFVGGGQYQYVRLFRVMVLFDMGGWWGIDV